MSSFNSYKFSFQILAILSVMMILTFASLSFAQLLDPATQSKFINPLPIPAQIDATKGGTFDMEMNQTTQWLGLVDAAGNPLYTTVWGYGQVGMGVTYPGPTFVAKKNVPVNVNWNNNLPGHFLPVDASLHMAHPAGLTMAQVEEWYAEGNVPAVTHLHGGHTESSSDGLPEAWYNQNGSYVGAYYVKQNYTYHNDQEAATLWYHDHALGITRLNVYAGLAGFYLLEDKTERDLVNDNVLPKGKHDIEIVIQDRMFDATGQLFLPSQSNDPWFGDAFGMGGEVLDLPFAPSIVAEFFGNFIVVNGTVWPQLSVEPRPYRFRLLNGSDSRFYVLEFGIPAMDFLQIATDDGLLPTALKLNRLVIAPGERAEVIVDFTGLEKNTIITLYNYGPDEPFRGIYTSGPYAGKLKDGEDGILDPADPSTTGQIMQFHVNQKLKVNKGLPIPTLSEGTTLRSEITDLGTPQTTRKLALFEGEDADGRLQPLLGVINGDDPKSATETNGSLAWFEDITENPMLNDVEIWEVYNATEDAHPIHLHLVAFQIIDRQPFIATVNAQTQIQHDGAEGIGGYIEESSIFFTDTPEEPADNERGWKDTFIVPPGYVGRVKAKFDRPGRYVWHCHILSHEDHEMMRPYHVDPIPAATAPILAKASAGTAEFAIDVDESVNTPTQFSLDQNYPNPFNPTTEIRFALPEDSYVQLRVFNSLGQEVATLIDGNAPAGYHTVQLDASNMASGVYFYRISAGNFTAMKKMMLIK